MMRESLFMLALLAPFSPAVRSDVLVIYNGANADIDASSGPVEVPITIGVSSTTGEALGTSGAYFHFVPDAGVTLVEFSWAFSDWFADNTLPQPGTITYTDSLLDSGL